eukprot:TRINITY_DN33544_c0_g1_i1.p1 TRINITY_DN33544_c0_g1~~TRINITY_DN33544_c0_g1_i1.p1  ORF type:complete len:739 (+),score=207.73 TRINITY_DN33544_c0_g1_i1:150-2366(+)
MDSLSCCGSVADTECQVKMQDSLAKAQEIVQAVQQLTKQNEDADRRTSREAKLHQQAKEKAKAVEDEHSRVRQAFDKQRAEHEASKRRLSEIDRFHVKSTAALKAMADDLMAVRTQNEALQAELEVQKKAFTVGVDWESMYLELKGKQCSLIQAQERLHLEHSQTQIALETAINSQEECKQAHAKILDALERAKEDLQRGEEVLKTAVSDEVAAELKSIPELEETLKIITAARTKQREKVLRAMEKSLACTDATLLSNAVTAWKGDAKSGLLKKNKKEQNMGVAMRAIAKSDLANQDFCLTAWAKEVHEARTQRAKEAHRELEERMGSNGDRAKIAHKKALAQLEKQFASRERGLVREVIAAWVGVRMARKKSDKAKALAGRSIASSAEALCKQSFSSWAQLLAELNVKRARKAAGNSRALRMITDAANAMLDFCLTQWGVLAQKGRGQRRAKLGGHTKASRMIASQSSAFLAMCITQWHQHKLQLKDREKKIKTIERHFVSAGNGLLQYLLFNWSQDVKKDKRRQVRKADSMGKGLKFIQQMNEALLHDVLPSWAHGVRLARISKLEQSIDALKTEPVRPHGEMLRNEKDIAELEPQLQSLKMENQAATERLQELERKAEEQEALLKERDRQHAKVQAELVESRRKARDINEELARVGAFLLSKPRKTRPSSGTKGERDGPLLPRIDLKMPNTARELRSVDRPESGGARSKADTISVASQGYSHVAAKQQAWSEASA